MKIKTITILLLIAGLSACGAKQKKAPPLKPQVQPVTNFHKAALLNVEMGEKYLAAGQISRAKQKFIHALELQPKMPEAHSSIGYFYEQVQDFQEAESHYRKAVSFGDGAGAFYNNYGTFLCRQKRYEEAEVAFRNAAGDKKYVNTSEVYENAGLCKLSSKENDKAFDYFELAVKRDPRRVNARLELATIEYQNQNYLMARDHLEIMKNYVKPNARALLLAIRVNKKLGFDDDVANAVLRLKNNYPKSKEYQEYLKDVRNG